MIAPAPVRGKEPFLAGDAEEKGVRLQDRLVGRLDRRQRTPGLPLSRGEPERHERAPEDRVHHEGEPEARVVRFVEEEVPGGPHGIEEAGEGLRGLAEHEFQLTRLLQLEPPADQEQVARGRGDVELGHVGGASPAV